jgi:cytochrome oxidase Cu insertion factor (SCO1/SenC/PrrC family)
VALCESRARGTQASLPRGGNAAHMPVDVGAAVRAAAVAAAFGAVGAAVYQLQLLLPRVVPNQAESAAAFAGTVVAHRLARTTLVSDDGRRVAIGTGTEPAAIVLGYTRCADRCPATLAALNRALEATPRGARVRALFLTTDPAHDTPAVLHRYLATWHHVVGGAIAAPEVIRRVQFELGAGSGARDDHDTRVFVVGASGDVVAQLPPETSVAQLRAALAMRR